MAGFLWGDIGDSRRLAAEVRADLLAVVAGARFPERYVMEGHTLDIRSQDEVMIEPHYEEATAQSVDIARLLAALELIAHAGRSP